MQRIQRGAVVEVILVEEAELEADVFTDARHGETSFRGVDRGGFLGLLAGNDLPNGQPPPDKGFRGTTSKNRRYHENPDKVGAMNERHLGCVRGSHLAGRRGIDKNSYTLKRH